MNRNIVPRPGSRLRPGLRAAVLAVSTLLVVGTAVAVSLNVSGHLADTAIGESVRATEAIVLGTVAPMANDTSLADPVSPEGAAINERLVKLTAGGQILRIKVWGPDGTIIFSDLPALRGARFAVDEDLTEALEGQTATEISDATADENVFERGLADRFLSIYLPIRSVSGDRILGVYEIYEDAAPIEADIDSTRRDVLLIVGGMALLLFGLLYLAFSGAARLLETRNRRLRESEQRFASLVRNSADVHMILNAKGVITYESPAIQHVLGFTPEDRVGHVAGEFVHPEDLSRLQQLFGDLARTAGTEVGLELRARHADGSWRTVEAVGKNLMDDPAVGGVVVNYRDITPRRALEDELRHQAFHDPLTGLPNRALFLDRLENALSRSRRSHAVSAVLFLDLDDFKTVNDSLGHGEGDQILVAAAARLGGAMRAGDTLARMGGDEFAVLVEDPPDVATAVEVGQALLATLQAPFTRSRKEVFVHASLGVAISKSRNGSAEALLRDADAAMYRAKSLGKNRIEVFEPSMHEAALTRLALKGDLERAVERGEFRLLYQPIVELATGEPVGVEALVRWDHPRRGVIMPTEFIPIAEETGVIVPLGRWVLEEACRPARRWEAARPDAPPTVSVNVSGRQVADGTLASDLGAVLSATGLDPARLILEFTEGVLMHDTELTVGTLNDLKRLGVGLAIDDFGTGFSSLNYLRLFPVDILKVDGSFVAGLSSGLSQRAVVQAILTLARTLDLATIAEGIEDAGQLAALRELGATRGQGFFFAPALSADEVTAMLAPRSGQDGQAARSPALTARPVAASPPVAPG
jgi:diguanylate cyclase (GGDEF)-like protein/PAS domain S-box-containing protein